MAQPEFELIAVALDLIRIIAGLYLVYLQISQLNNDKDQ